VPAPPSAESTGRKDLHVRVERALLRLPPRLRVVADLAFAQEWTHEEIAEALGISRSAVKARAFRAMRQLKEALRREGIEP
jgi:RNA polymerase sigma factor (sigma-70 family)